MDLFPPARLSYAISVTRKVKCASCAGASVKPFRHEKLLLHHGYASRRASEGNCGKSQKERSKFAGRGRPFFIETEAPASSVVFSAIFPGVGSQRCRSMFTLLFWNQNEQCHAAHNSTGCAVVKHSGMADPIPKQPGDNTCHQLQ